MTGIAAVVIASRFVVYALGVRFDRSTLGDFWQFADPELLRDDFFRSIWWFHAQPPAFNVFIGSVLHLPSWLELLTYTVVFVGCGITIALCMYVLARDLRVPARAAAIVAVLFAISPTAIVYENLLFYTYPAAALVCLTFVGLSRYLRVGSTRAAALSFGAAGLLVLTRASFHLVWLLALVAVVLCARPHDWRRTLAVAALPLVLVAGWYARGYVLFGSFGGSSWVGMNLARVVENSASQDEMQRLVDEGKVSKLLRVMPFSAPDKYGPLPPRTGVRVLDQIRKPGGQPNFNHSVYPDVSKRYLTEDLRFIRARPWDYLATVATSFRYYASPATAQDWVDENVHALPSPYVSAYQRIVMLQPADYDGANPSRRGAGPPNGLEIEWTAVVGYAVALGVLPFALWQVWRRRGTVTDRWWLLVALSGTVWFAVLIDVFMEYGENSRFRVETDPVVWVVLAAAITALFRDRRSHRRAVTRAREPGSDEPQIETAPTASVPS